MASTSPPYPGLRPFRQDEHLLFFGRFDQTAALYRLLDRGRFLAVVGGSGSGKSSLVRAGLLPLLAGETNPRGAERWLIVALRPGVHPVNRLAAALCEAAGISTDPLERVATGLRRTSGGLANEVGRLFPVDREVLILVDQFEELFRYADAACGDLLPSSDRSAVHVAQEDEARRFVDSLLTASSETQRRIRVALTMRSDFVGDCARFPGLAEAVSGNQYLTPRLDRDQLTEAIVGPLLRVSGRLDPDARELPWLEPGEWTDLIEPRLVEQLENDAGDNPDQLPVLQHALLRCWQTAGGARLDLDRYRGLGGWGKVLSGHADEVQQRCGPARHQLVERVFRALTELDREGRAIRRPRTMAQLIAETGAPDPDIRAVVTEFSAPDCSFLVPPMPPDELVDIGHEALIRNWSSLRESWIEAEHRDGDRWRSLLELTTSGDRVGKALIDWWHTRRPSAAWAARWCGHSAEAERELVAAHIEWSEAELERELEEQHARKEAEERAREAELRVAHEAQRLAEERASRLRESAEAAERFAAQQEALANSEKQRAEEHAAAAKRAKRLLLRSRIVSFIAVATLIGTVSFYLLWSSEDKRYLADSMKLITTNANSELTTSILEAVAMRFLYKWWDGDEKYIHMVAKALRNNEKVVPEEHGFYNAISQKSRGSMELLPESGRSKKIAARLLAPPSVNNERIKQYWRSDVAKILAEDLGLPLPADIEVQTDDTIDQTTLRLDGLQFPLVQKSAAPSSGESASQSEYLVLPLNNELERGQALVLMSDINEKAKNFMSAFNGAWNRRQLSEINEMPALVVPRWSFPLWKAQGVPLHAPELATAIALRDELLRRPHAALSREATVFLLNRMRDFAPFSLEEALAARGDVDGLWKDMVESLQRNTQSLNYLPYLLDELGSTPSESSKEAMEQILRSLQSKEPLYLDKLPGKKSRKTFEDASDKVSFGDVADQLHSYAPVIVEISDSLVDVIATPDPDRRLRDDISKAVDEVRQDLYRHFGVLAPGVRFRPMWEKRSYASFQILFLDQRVVLRRIAPQGNSNGSTLVTPDLAVKTIFEKLRSQLDDSRQWLITADTVDQLLSGSGDAFAPVRNWLNEQYTHTDLKLLLRAVLRPDNDPAATIRRAPWLLGSLVFWAAFDDTSDVQMLASYLRDTQRALGNPATLVRPEQGVSSFVETGLDHLRGGDLHEAVEAFRQAKKRDPDGAKEAFLRLYTKMYIQEYPEQLAEICGLPPPGNAAQPMSLSKQQLWDVQDYLAAEQGEEQPYRANLQLCLMRGYYFAQDRENADVVLHQLLNESKVKPLSPANSYLVGYYILSADHDDLSPGKKTFEQASALLRTAFNGMELTDAEKGFEELLQACRSHPQQLLSCLQLLESFADANANSFEIPFKLAQAYLNHAANSEEVQAALRLLNRVDTHLATTFNKGDDQRAWLALEQARANLMMGARGDGEALQKADKLLQAFRKDAALERMELTDAEKGFEELLQACRSPPFGLACLKRVRMLSSMHWRSFWIPFELAETLLDYSETPEAAQEALTLLVRADNNLATAGKNIETLPAWLDLLEARADLVLGANGDQEALTRAYDLLETLRENTSLQSDQNLLPMVWNYLSTYWKLRGDIDREAATLEDALKRWPSNSDLKSSQNYFRLLSLAKKDPSSAWAAAKEQLNRNDLSDNMRENWLYQASLIGLITDATGHEEYVDEFLKMKSEYQDNIRMIQYWSFRESGASESAKKLLDARWDEVKKSASNWDNRLALGDASVWREKLIGCYHDDVTCPDIFDALNEAKFSQSAFAALGVPLRALQCEAYFYDALRQHVTGDPATRDARYRASLRKVLDTGYALYVEYDFAAYLLDLLEQGKPFHAAGGAPWRRFMPTLTPPPTRPLQGG